MDRFIKLYAHFLLLTLGCLPMQGSLNVIYLNADDLGVMDVGFMGSKLYQTPNLDRLAKEGILFTEAYAPAANCAPSRAVCMCGSLI